MLLPISQNIFFPTLPFSSAFSFLSHTRHMIPVQTMRSGMKGKSGSKIFLLTSNPGFLAFLSIRIRGFVFLFLVPVWKHFTPAGIECVNCKMGKVHFLRSSVRPGIKGNVYQYYSCFSFSSEREGKVIPIFPFFLLKTQSFYSLLNNIVRHIIRNLI